MKKIEFPDKQNDLNINSKFVVSSKNTNEIKHVTNALIDVFQKQKNDNANIFRFFQITFLQNSMNDYDSYNLVLRMRSNNLIKEVVINQQPKTLYKFDNISGKYSFYTKKTLNKNCLKNNFLIDASRIAFLQNSVLTYFLHDIESNKDSQQHPLFECSMFKVNDNDITLKEDFELKLRQRQQPISNDTICDYYCNIKSLFKPGQQLQLKVFAKYYNQQIQNITNQCEFSTSSLNTKFSITNNILKAPNLSSENEALDIFDSLKIKVNIGNYSLIKNYIIQAKQTKTKNIIQVKLSENEITVPSLSSFFGNYQVFFNFNNQRKNISNDQNLSVFIPENDENKLIFQKNYNSISGNFKVQNILNPQEKNIWFSYKFNNAQFFSQQKKIKLTPEIISGQFNAKYKPLALSGVLILSDDISDQLSGVEINSDVKNFYSLLLNAENGQHINLSKKIITIQPNIKIDNSIVSGFYNIIQNNKRNFSEAPIKNIWTNNNFYIKFNDDLSAWVICKNDKDIYYKESAGQLHQFPWNLTYEKYSVSADVIPSLQFVNYAYSDNQSVSLSTKNHLDLNDILNNFTTQQLYSSVSISANINQQNFLKIGKFDLPNQFNFNHNFVYKLQYCIGKKFYLLKTRNFEINKNLNHQTFIAGLYNLQQIFLNQSPNILKIVSLSGKFQYELNSLIKHVWKTFQYDKSLNFWKISDGPIKAHKLQCLNVSFIYNSNFNDYYSNMILNANNNLFYQMNYKTKTNDAPFKYKIICDWRKNDHGIKDNIPFAPSGTLVNGHAAFQLNYDGNTGVIYQTCIQTNIANNQQEFQYEVGQVTNNYYLNQFKSYNINSNHSLQISNSMNRSVIDMTNIEKIVILADSLSGAGLSGYSALLLTQKQKNQLINL